MSFRNLFRIFCTMLMVSLHSFSLAENPHKDRIPTVLPFATEQITDDTLIPVEFEFHHTLAVRDSGVGINGSFNGWTDVYKCQHTGDDTWTRVLYLKPGRYYYKFVTYTDTVGQAGVTGWYTDALNPDFTGPYRDSDITVTDPMIYYFLPLRNSETNIKQPEMKAKLTTALKNELVASSIQFAINNSAVPEALNYFDVSSKKFLYLPPEKLEVGTYGLTLSVQNSEGTSKQGATNFTLVKGILEAPYTLLFDGKSPFLELVDPVQRVSFEWMDQPYTSELFDEDGDGIFSRTVNLKVNQQRIYRVIVNQDIYLEMDPTNPNVSEELRSIVRKVVDPNPRVVDFHPPQGTIFHTSDTTVAFSSRITTSDSAFALDLNSIAVAMDGSPIPFTTDGRTDTVTVQFEAMLNEGRHVFNLSAVDIAGMQTHSALFSVGVYPENSGYHFVDGEKDDDGYGSYLYPVGVSEGSADVGAIHINFNEQMDSLLFSIDMADIGDVTRIGLGICNRLTGDLIDAQESVELRIPEWQDHGAFAIIAAPTASTLRQTYDNKLFTSRKPLTAARDIAVNPDALNADHFDFSLPVADLESILGSYNQMWYFTAYSYLITSSGSFEVTRTEGGVKEFEDPDIYDLAFCPNTLSQQLLLQNYLIPSRIGGPRIASIGTLDRGAVGLRATDIQANYVPAPVLKLFANGGVLYTDSVRIAGSISDPSISTVTLYINDVSIPVDVHNQIFDTCLGLASGINKIHASAVYDGNQMVSSIPIEYDYRFDPTPTVIIRTTISDNLVTLDGNQTFNPDQLPMTYSWKQDEANPQPVTFSSKTGVIITFTAPTVPGEYYFTLSAKAGSKSGWGRTVLLVDDRAHSVDLETWHPAWVDSMILYEIFVRTYSVTGKLSAVKGRMSMIDDFGANCIWLMPIHPSPSTHGYWITDYYNINPDYGTLDDFRSLVTEAHKYGIKVILDLVINHTADTHPFMLDALAHGEYSPYRDFYQWNADGSFQYLYTWVNLPSINYATEWVQDYLIDMCKWWVQKYNVDGFRCDVAHAIETGRPEGPAFWQRWRQELKQMKPDIFLLAEASAAENTYFDEKFDSGYDYWLYGAIKNALSGTAYANDLNQVVMHYSDNIPEHARPMRYIENHDEGRFLKNFTLAQTQLAAAMTFTLPGVPLIYAGQEAGELESRGIVHWGDSNHLKPYYEKLIAIRKTHPALRDGRYVHLGGGNQNVFSFLRNSGDDHLLIAANLSGSVQSANLSIPLAELPYDTTAVYYLNNLLGEKSISARGTALSLTLAPNEVLIYEFSTTSIGVNHEDLKQKTFELALNYPNPFNAETQIRYTIGGDKPVETTLEIYNVLGQKVQVLVNERQQPGRYQMVWNGNGLSGGTMSSGIYICRFRSGNFVRTMKMLALK